MSARRAGSGAGDVAEPADSRFARAVVFLRWILVPAWIAVTVVLQLQVAGFESARGGGFESIVPRDAPAVQNQLEAIRRFGFPVVSHVMVVQRDPDGLPATQHAEAVTRAARLTFGSPEGIDQVAGALPLTNAFGLFPWAREEGTTTINYLLFRPEVPPAEQARVAEAVADRLVDTPEGGFVGVTGAVPARLEQGRQITSALPWVELGTVVVVALVVGLTFRSVVAPLVALAAAAIAYLCSVRLLVLASDTLGLALPGELEPLIVVLIVGVMTDYTIFFLGEVRHGLRGGRDPKGAVRHAATVIVPIVVVAALTVAGGTAALLVAELELFARLGPGMALSVVVAMAVAITFIPAALAIVGRMALWPAIPEPDSAEPDEPAAERRSWRIRLARFGVKRPVAVVTAVVGFGGLIVASAPLRDAEIGANLVTVLPEHTEPFRAASEAARGFAPGILAPTEVIVAAPGVADDRDRLARFQRLLDEQPGVVGVVGPAQQPTPLETGLLLAPGDDAARFFLVYDRSPYSAAAVHDVSVLKERLPALLDRVGLAGADVGVAGDTALADTLLETARTDIVRVAVATAIVDLVLLAIFLRSLVAPVLVLVSTGVVVLVALAFTSFVFDGLLGVPSFTFYVPLAVGVLLVALGSDYNVFIVGRIWRAAERQPLPDAIVEAGSRAASAIAAAGVALALSFALLALVPLDSFREFAFAMVVGILLDTFVVRTVLVPAMLAALGRFAAWPSTRLDRAPS